MTRDKILIFWDIDGTLLNTARAGVYALEDAYFALTGEKIDLQAIPTAGLTDAEIVRAIFTLEGRTVDSALIEKFLRLYESRLPECLPRRQGEVLPGVEDILKEIDGRSDVVSMLLTGNTSAGAQAKLRHYGLDRYFRWGSFCDGATDRVSIARKALEMSREIVGEIPLDNICVVGDTPHDIRCAKAIGAKAVAVATGSHGLEDLERHEPWWALERLPDPPAFLKELWNRP